MAKLPRVTAKVFASNAAAEDIGQFGSALEGDKVLTSDIAQIQALPAYETGWRAAVISDRNYPTLQEMNGLQKNFSQQIAYTLQMGIPEWDNATDYYASSFVQASGQIYKSLSNNNIGNNPLTDTTNWVTLVANPEWGNITGTLSNQTDLQNALDAKSNIDLSNLSETGEKHFLNKTQITNCILEAPHMVDFKISNGTVTLKAGSKVIIPYGKSAPTKQIGNALNGGTIVDISWDGTNLFYIVQYTTDISKTISSTSSLFWSITNQGALIESGIERTVSGTTTPSTTDGGYVWYDTANNIVKRNGNSTPESYIPYFSLPFCETSSVGSVISSVVQNFQSIGYIGATIWVNKGVKALAPNGRNEDGTLNNALRQTTYVQTNSYTESNSGIYVSISDAGTIALNGVRTYDETSNILYNSGGVAPNAEFAYVVKTTGGVITSFESKLPFHAVDYNDTNFIAHQAMPDYSSGENKLLSTTYEAKSDGLITFGYANDSSASDDLVFKLTITYKGVVNTFVISYFSLNSDYIRPLIQMPIPKGASYKLEVTYGTSPSDYQMKYFPLIGG